LAYEADGTLRSAQFGDVYASRAGAAAQAEYVFLCGNDLPKRWSSTAYFTIGELGFGAGTNFAVTRQRFLETAPDTHRLHYLSFEQYPLRLVQLQELHGDADWLDAYPLPLPGFHRVHYGRVMLTLAIGDALSLLQQIDTPCVDAWYLDGFAPSKNPELWNANIYNELARLSHRPASCATYSASASVREGLEQAGFAMEKRSGFASKKAMLAGVLA
jgi:tRNA 5-methylaminomethyl-2-thiouridine biosynthesis bifunctional protein